MMAYLYHMVKNIDYIKIVFGEQGEGLLADFSLVWCIVSYVVS